MNKVDWRTNEKTVRTGLKRPGAQAERLKRLSDELLGFAFTNEFKEWLSFLDH